MANWRASGGYSGWRMADKPQEVIRTATQAEVLPLLRLAEGDDVQGLGLDAILKGCEFFILEGSGDKLAFALSAVGSELWVQAAGGSGNRNLTRLILNTAEHLAKGTHSSVGFQTRRRGLVKKAQALGYEIDGYILRKKL